jgi:hypothetical protein
MGVVRPPPDRPVWGWPNHPHGPRGASHPLWGGSATPLFFLFFFIDLKGWLGHPLRPWGWFGHPQIGRSGGGRTTPMAQGVPATPMGVVRPPSFFSFFFLILIYFIFKIKFLKNNILLVKTGAF